MNESYLEQRIEWETQSEFFLDNQLMQTVRMMVTMGDLLRKPFTKICDTVSFSTMLAPLLRYL